VPGDPAILAHGAVLSRQSQSIPAAMIALRSRVNCDRSAGSIVQHRFFDVDRQPSIVEPSAKLTSQPFSTFATYFSRFVRSAAEVLIQSRPLARVDRPASIF